MSHRDPDGHGGAGGRDDNSPGEGARRDLTLSLSAGSLFAGEPGWPEADMSWGPRFGDALIPTCSNRHGRRTRCGHAVKLAKPATVGEPVDGGVPRVLAGARAHLRVRATGGHRATATPRLLGHRTRGETAGYGYGPGGAKGNSTEIESTAKC